MPNLPIIPASIPCPLITMQSEQGSSFIRSDFDYDTRQRRVNCSKPKFTASFNMSQLQYNDFLLFYEETLVSGVREFSVDWNIHGIISIDKVVRFVAPFNFSELKGGLYKISINCELLERGV